MGKSSKVNRQRVSLRGIDSESEYGEENKSDWSEIDNSSAGKEIAAVTMVSAFDWFFPLFYIFAGFSNFSARFQPDRMIVF